MHINYSRLKPGPTDYFISFQTWRHLRLGSTDKRHLIGEIVLAFKRTVLKKYFKLFLFMILALAINLSACKTSQKRPGKIPKKGAIPCPTRDC